MWTSVCIVKHLRHFSKQAKETGQATAPDISMNLKERKILARKVATRVYGQHPAPARLGKARRMIETLLDDDELVSGIPGIDAKAHIAVVYDEAVRRLTDATRQIDT